MRLVTRDYEKRLGCFLLQSIALSCGDVCLRISLFLWVSQLILPELEFQLEKFTEFANQCHQRVDQS